MKMTLSNEQIEKIKKVRKYGFSYLGSKRALEETEWNIEKSIDLLLSNNDYGKYCIK